MTEPVGRTDRLRGEIDHGSVRRRTLHGAGATAVAQVLKFGLQFGSQIVLARMLDPAQFGLVAMVMPVLGLVMALNDFGLGPAIVQRADITQGQVSALFWLNTGIGLGFTALVLGLSPLVAYLYDEPRTTQITMALASLVLLTSLSAVPLALLSRQMRFVSLAGIEVAAMVAGLASGLAAAWAGAGYWALVVMQAVNATVSMLLAWFACDWRPLRPQWEPGVGSLVRFGANIMGSNVASYLSMSADNVIVGVVSGNVQLGLYDRSYNLVVKPLWQLMAPVSRLAVPLLSRLQDAPERYARSFLLMLQATSSACVPGLIATIVCAEPLIQLLLGPKWAGMVPIFVWICFGGLASPLSSSTYWLLVTQNRPHEQMRFGTINALISIAAFLLGSRWGAVGVACVAALSFMFVQTPLVVWAATRRGPVTRGMLVHGLLPLVAAGVASAVFAKAALQWTSGPAWWVIVATFVAAYGGFVATLVAQPAGRQLLMSARAALVSRSTTPA